MGLPRLRSEVGYKTRSSETEIFTTVTGDPKNFKEAWDHPYKEKKNLWRDAIELDRSL